MSEKKIFFIFPGQGSQYSGMGSDLEAAYPGVAQIYDRASEAAGFDMRELSFSDPRGELDLTRFTQPALLAHQYACLQAFREASGNAVMPVVAAGHSLGEYTALVASGVLDFEDAVRLVARRGALMSEYGRGGMLATRLDPQNARRLADKHYCGIGGCNLPDQTVIAGEEADLDAVVADLTAEQPRARAVRLNTEGAFHSYLMVAAAERFRPALGEVDFSEPAFPVLSNYTGKLHEAGADAVRSRLFFQLFNPVRWVTCMQTAFEQGVDAVVEFGGGIGSGESPAEKRPNLEGIVRKFLKFSENSAEYAAAINVAGIEAAVALIGQ